LLDLCDLLARTSGRCPGGGLETALHPLNGQLEPGEVGLDLVQILLGGRASHLGHPRASAEAESPGEEERAPPRRGYSSYCALVRKWARRF
jgi:hypothetical protein